MPDSSGEPRPLPAIDSLWNYAKPAESEARFRTLLETPGLDEAVRAEVLTQVSRACCLQRRYADARRALDEALPLLRQDANRAYVRYLLESGRLAKDTGAPHCGLPEYEHAWRWGGECGEDFYAVDAAHMLGYVLKGAESVRWHEEGIRKAEASADARAKRWLFRLFCNLAQKQVEIGEFEDALLTCQKALDWCGLHDAPAAQWRDANWHLALAYRKSGRVAWALALQRELEKQIADGGEPPDGFVLEELAECLLALDRPDEAQGYFARAYASHRDNPWFPPAEAERLERIRRLGGVTLPP